MANPNNPFHSPANPPANPYAAPPPAPGQASFNPYAAPKADFNYGPTPNPGMGEFHVLASRGSRFLGSLLDGLIYVLFMLPPVFIFASMNNEEAAIGGMIVGFLIIEAIQAYLISTTGQSIAKKLMGMKIIKLDGSDVNFVSGVLARRWSIVALSMIPFIGNFVNLADALFIFGEEHRCLHDHIAGTKVISV